MIRSVTSMRHILQPSFIERVLKSIQPSTDAEVTLEANPNVSIGELAIMRHLVHDH